MMHFKVLFELSVKGKNSHKNKSGEGIMVYSLGRRIKSKLNIQHVVKWLCFILKQAATRGESNLITQFLILDFKF